MENHIGKNLGSGVDTGKGLSWETERISRIINLLPEDGGLTISRGHGKWNIECHIDGRLLLRAGGQSPCSYLGYIEDLLGKLKGFDKDA